MKVDYKSVIGKLACNSVYKEIASLQSSWTLQDKTTPFFTLGKPAYLNFPKKDYFVDQEKNNKLLTGKFALLYDTVFRNLAAILGAPVVFGEKLNVPGFHIFLSHKKMTANYIPVPHIDIQVLYVLGNDIKLNDFASFTLCIDAPDTCSGLEVWEPAKPLREDIISQLSADSIGYMSKGPLANYVAESRLKKPKFIQYTPGYMVVHHGLFFHRPVIATAGQLRPRITLQGHCVKKDGKFIAFW